MCFILLFVLCAYEGVVVKAQYEDINITNLYGFIEFSCEVDKGTSFAGNTVLLRTDLDFAENTSYIMKPIGVDKESASFAGTFDGQGHVIKNLNLSYYGDYVGLFGYSNGLTIKNIVLDSSCSIIDINELSDLVNAPEKIYVGGIIGYCGTNSDTDHRFCLIENVVNMASVNFVGNNSDLVESLYIGGIAGAVLSSNNRINIRNCVNYGKIALSNLENAYAGGILGYAEYAKENSEIHIQNCLNYGTILLTERNLPMSYFGSILGYTTVPVYIDSCVGFSKTIFPSGSDNYACIIGEIKEYDFEKLFVSNSFWSSKAVCKFNATGLQEVNQLNESLVDILNNNSLSTDYQKSRWFTLHLNGGKINGLDQDILVATQKHFPVPEKEDHTFKDWCLDKNCTEKYDPDNVNETSIITSFYVNWSANTYVVTFVC